MEIIIKGLVSFFGLGYLLIVVDIIRGWNKIKNPQVTKDSHTTKVSVIIPARNEEKMIGLCVGDVLKQNYPTELLEIIVIDDHSTDKTAEVIQQIDYPNLKLIRLKADPALNSYKKKAIADAIHIASGDLIVTTDGDCRMGENWIRSVVNEYECTGNKMISSPVVYFEECSMFEEMQTLEFMMLVSLGAATLSNGRAGSCNGANLAYEKKAFYEVEGFNGIDNIASGDDELLLHKMMVSYSGRVSFLKQRDAIVYTHAKPSVKEFIMQRRRWASKSVKYKNKAMVAMGLTVFAFYVSVLLLGAVAVFYPECRHFFWSVFMFKLVLDMIWALPIVRFFNRMSVLAWAPVVCFIHLFYLVYIGFAGQSKQYEWKGRMVR
ncbi:glycosyltransferase [Solitalea koreensis]|uniref:Glycosyltransferase, catalytic subunit of cellulose synthase and poly-beta-1,6-N-acetylglucosamine synthase n=1 Tax=Solitalea koreensis TaxID=543615 RepID=A0A521AQH9_9SPHI|nr:glycosyltransferase [Solitalea koreensis]SMO37045.1 Glycosyltransferase, catalytic subunit of cellulose synthase and poly-beta-1,6-N-acetylglucosamine synthase [Solitalea koreensis]